MSPDHWALQVGTIHALADDASGGAQIGPTDHLSLVEQIAVCAARHETLLWGGDRSELAEASLSRQIVGRRDSLARATERLVAHDVGVPPDLAGQCLLVRSALSLIEAAAATTTHLGFVG
jgi:hypothetical protein